jgi:hypothetical protein
MPAGIYTRARFTRVCAICGRGFEALRPNARYCSRLECRRETGRQRASAYYLRNRERILAGNKEQHRASDAIYRAKHGSHCLDCGSLASPGAVRCLACFKKNRRKMVSLHCNGCREPIERKSKDVYEHVYCHQCRGMLTRASLVLGLTKVRISQLVSETQKLFGGNLTRRTALEYVLQKRGASSEEIFNSRAALGQ